MPSVMALKLLLNKTADTDRGVKTWKSPLLEAVNKPFGVILSEALYCVATMLDARYKDRYFDADKKQGLREMLHTQLDKMETDTVTAPTEEERPQTDRRSWNFTAWHVWWNPGWDWNDWTNEQWNSTAGKWKK